MNHLLFTLILLSCSVACFPQKSLAPTGLTTELLRAPDASVITDKQPDFGWIIPTNGIQQTSYQIQIASSLKLLNNREPDIWDSKQVKSNKSINISFEGIKLSPNSQYWWHVKVWDKNLIASDFSVPQLFNTGNFKRADDEWKGQSNWVKLNDDNWVTENRQKATFQEKKPRLLEQTSTKSWFADFGKAAFATLELSVYAETENSTMTIFLGERKNIESTVNKIPGKSNIGFHKFEINLKKGTHQYKITLPPNVARSPHSQKLAPFYPEVLPFRYVEVIANADIKIKGITQLALYYYFDNQASSFFCSNANLNRVWDLCKYTLKATPFLGVYCDGNRERMPYEADAYIQQLGHYSVDREFSAAQYTIAFLNSHASWPTEWQMHTVMMAREHLMYTGDTELIAQIYDNLRKKTLIDLARKDGLISTKTGKVTPEFLKSIHFSGESINDIVDWPKGTPKGEKQRNNQGPTPEGERDGFVFTDYNTVVNAFHFYSLKCMSEIAKALNIPNDSEFFLKQSEKVRMTIMQNMFDKKRGIFIDGIGTNHASLHANMFPLAFNLVPQEHIKTVADYIKTKGMACSVYGAQYLLEALYNAGEAEYALSLMTSENKRSWINMLNAGSTMTTEAWDEYYKPNLTWNHAWGAAPGNIIPRRLLGIQPLDAGFETFLVNPQPAGLTSIDLTIPTIRGAISCKINSTEENWQIDLTVPGNSEASVLIPTKFSTVNINFVPAKISNVIHYLGKSRNLVRLKSGIYTISAKK